MGKPANRYNQPKAKGSTNMSNDNANTETTDVGLTPAQPAALEAAPGVPEVPVENTTAEADAPAVEVPAVDQTLPADAPVEEQSPVDEVQQEVIEVPVPATQVVAPAEVVVVDTYTVFSTITESLSTSSQLAVHELDAYIADATYGLTRRVTPEKGAATQATLYRALKGAVNAPAEDFTVVMKAFLKAIHAHRNDVFHETKVLRHMPYLSLTKSSIDSFRYLVNMFTSLADPQSRKLTSKQINFDITLGHKDIREDSRQRVLAFFNV